MRASGSVAHLFTSRHLRFLLVTLLLSFYFQPVAAQYASCSDGNPPNNTPQPPSGFGVLKFDDFSGSSLDPFWTTINGNLYGNSIYLSGNCLVEYAATGNNLGWGSNKAPVATTASPVTTDFDFRAEASWTCSQGPSQCAPYHGAFRAVGIVIFQDYCNWLYIDQFPEGKVDFEYSNLCSESANVVTYPVAYLPIYLRITRSSGYYYNLYFSSDGSSWQQLTSTYASYLNPTSTVLGLDTRSWGGDITGYYDWAVIYAPGAPPANVSVTVASSPAGAGYVSVDGSSITTPKTYTWTPGSTHTLAASSPVSCGSGCQYLWQSWTDNGAQTHTITVPNNSTTYTAIFQQQYSLTVSAGSGGATAPSGTSWQNVGQQVSVSETPSSGYTFTGWVLDGQNAGNQSPASVTMDQAHSLTANFAPIGTLCPYVNTDPPDLTPQPSQVPSCPVEPGTQVTITAQPIPNWKFENFTVTGVAFTQNGNSVTFTMPSSAVTVIAHYSSTIAPPAQGIAIPAYDTPVLLLWAIAALLMLFFTTRKRGHRLCRR